MGRTFRCKHCGKIVSGNPRVKSEQRYCGLSSCQAARKNAWEKEKIRKDDDYRHRRRASKANWRKRYPSHLYQHKYRESHPGYVFLNREKQQQRNEKRKVFNTRTKIVKTDALTSERLITAGLYEFLPCRQNNSGKIVKSDALMVQLSLIQSNTTFFVQPMTGL